MSLLALQGVTAGYAPGRDVVCDVSLELAPGDVMALVGPNGGGKSTVLRVASRVLRPRQGRVLIEGRDIARADARSVARWLAVVPQESLVPAGLSVRELVELGRTPHMALLFGPRRVDRAAVAWALEVTHTRELADAFVDELSGGERQRAILARALAQQPRVLLLDEPTANLDLHHQVMTLELVRGLAADTGLAVLAAIHDLELAALYCDRVVLLGEGRVVAAGTPEEMLTPGLLEATFGQSVAVAPHPTHGVPLVSLNPNGHARRANLP